VEPLWLVVYVDRPERVRSFRHLDEERSNRIQNQNEASRECIPFIKMRIQAFDRPINLRWSGLRSSQPAASATNYSLGQNDDNLEVNAHTAGRRKSSFAARRATKRSIL
jgi:hypothetical protein